jgi:hypothetical protein
MFTRQIFETLPISVIALSILIMALLHSTFVLFAGGVLIVLSCVILYRRYSELGTNPDVMDYVHIPSDL